MAAVYYSVCDEADELLLHVISLAEKELKIKLEIEKLMNEGYVKIAKARYIMGSSCVTKMQLPSEKSNPIKPLVTVWREEINKCWVFHIRRKNGQKNNKEFPGENFLEIAQGSDHDLSSSSKSSLDSVDCSEAAFRHILQTNPKSLKKSKNAFLVENTMYNSCNDELLDELSNSGSKESLASVTDPMRLFGILVPICLKEAQTIFSNAVNLLGKCATVQFELGETLHKYNHLVRVKKLIEVASKKSKIDFLKPKIYWTPTESSEVSCYALESEEEEKGSVSEVSVQKSIRSVFYDIEHFEPQEQTELHQIWSSRDIKSDDDNKENEKN